MGLENVLVKFAINYKNAGQMTSLYNNSLSLCTSLSGPPPSLSYLLTSSCVGDGTQSLKLVDIAALPLAHALFDTHPLRRFFTAQAALQLLILLPLHCAWFLWGSED